MDDDRATMMIDLDDNEGRMVERHAKSSCCRMVVTAAADGDDSALEIVFHVALVVDRYAGAELE